MPGGVKQKAGRKAVPQAAEILAQFRIGGPDRDSCPVQLPLYGGVADLNPDLSPKIERAGYLDMCAKRAFQDEASTIGRINLVAARLVLDNHLAIIRAQTNAHISGYV